MADNKEVLNEADPKDINQNVGSFSESVVPAVTEVNTPVVNPAETKTSQIEQDPNLNFEKFSRTKSRHHRSTKSRFGIKVEGWLTNTKSLILIWGIIFACIAILWAIQIYYIVAINGDLKTYGNTPGPFMMDPGLKRAAYAGEVFSYMSILLPVIPIVYLITSWFIGINGVHSSRIFHYVFWSILAVSFLFLLISSCCSLPPITNCNEFNPYVPPES